MTDERALIDFVTSQRWYGSKTRDVIHASVVDSATLRDGLQLQLIEVRFDTGTHETYQLLTDAGGFAALGDEAQAPALLELMRAGARVDGEDGVLEFASLGSPAEAHEARLITAEQSNTSVVFDDQLILKVFRKVEAGINPELELLRFLTEKGFPYVPALAGWYSYAGPLLDATLGILQAFVPHGTDGWAFALGSLEENP